MILIMQHLFENGMIFELLSRAESCILTLFFVLYSVLLSGYLETAEKLRDEAGTALTKFEAADNLDLSLILTEYEAYYEMRYDKKPKLVRKLKEGEEPSIRIGPTGGKGNTSEKRGTKASASGNGKETKPPKPAVLPAAAAEEAGGGSLGVAGAGLSVTGIAEKKASGSIEDSERVENRYLSLLL
jgi:katanin p60 ATPase-containing subunit A1